MYLLISGNEISGTAFTLTSVLGSTTDPNLPDRCYGGDLSESLKSGANDVVIVPQTDGTLKFDTIASEGRKIVKLENHIQIKERKDCKIVH